MAALMKKRVLAELNQSQVVVNEPPTKIQRTLKLKNGFEKSSALAYVECLEKCKCGNDALQLLVRISDTLSQMSPDDVPIVVQKLSERFTMETEAAVRTKILWVFAELGALTSDANEKVNIINETLKLMKDEESHRVKSQGLATLLKLGEYNRSAVVSTAREHLHDTWHGVQTRCLAIIGRYLPSNNVDDILNLVRHYATSQDPRVRSQAFETMAEIHLERGCRLPASLFTEACNALRDDYEIVRRAVLKLIWLLGNEYPDNMIAGSDGEETRMVDCAFSQICGFMGDLSPRVRTAAMGLLGKMKGVSRRYIEQALDKKQMVVDDVRSEVEERSGSCGAFIHGLEDEFLEVRMAAVEALCTLSLQQPSIARISLEFMVDMFNDEIQDVRILAIESLRKISSSVTLQEDQLETILGALEDFSDEVREGLHATLAASRLSTRNCLHMCVNRLIDNLTRYPQDRESIRGCLAALGASHPYLTLPLVPQLLARHPFFDTPEPDAEEPSYASILVLIFNAALHCPSMLALFTEHTAKHYHYLRDTMPHLVPHLRGASNSGLNGDKNLNNEDARDKKGRDFLEGMASEIERAPSGSRVHTQLLEAATLDLDRLAKMDRQMEGAAKFTAFYIRCLILLRSIVSDLSTSSNNCLLSDSNVNTSSNISLLLKHTQKLQRLFSGLEERDVILANDVWLKSLAVELIQVSRSSTAGALPLARHFLAEAETLPQDTMNLPPFSAALVRQVATLVEMKPGSLPRILLPLLSEKGTVGNDRLPRASAMTRLCSATIEEPRSDADASLKFTGGLLLGIPLTAKILNLRDRNCLRIKLRLPDQQVQLLLPRKSDLKEQSSSGDYRLRTTVLLSHQVWMEACNVEISLALLVPTTSHCSHPPQDDPCVIDICKPTKVSVAPKQAKKGV